MKKQVSNIKNARINIQPVADRVLVKRLDEEGKKSAAGIIIPDTAQKEKSKIGLVIAVGPGRYGDEGDLIPMTIKVGSKVVFNSGWDNEGNAGNEDEDLFLVKESDILATIK